MRVQIDPRRVELIPGTPVTVVITVTNTTEIISGYQIRILGADPGWVSLDSDALSLFPSETRTVVATVTPPAGLGAGDRRFAVQVRELTPPTAIAVHEIDLVVPAQEAAQLTLSPMTVMCGSTGRFGVVAENTGNTVLRVRPVGLDPQAKIEFEFSPPEFELAPGEQLIADLRAKRRRPWFGSPAVRQLGIGLEPAAPKAGPDGQQAGDPELPPEPIEPLTQGSMVQKPRLGRGALSLLSLLLAVTVFAVVITVALSRLVTASAMDRDLAIQVAAARDNAGSGGSSALGGTVNLLADGSPAAGVAVELYDAATLGEAILSTATDSSGTWLAEDLPAGSYKVKFLGAGFAEVWFPAALTGADAEAVTLQPGQQLTDLAITLGGLPATISGEVLGDDVAGAILTLTVPAELLPNEGAVPQESGPSVVTGVPTDAVPTGEAPAESAEAEPTATPGPQTGGVVRQVPIGGDGTFVLEDLVSPAIYDLTVSKPGFAGTTQRVDLDGGESRSGVQLRLRSGDGLVSGRVMGADGPLGDALVTATSGGTTITTVTLTTGDADEIGTYTLRGLVTPGTWTITVSKDGFTTQSSTVTLSAQQKLDGIDLTLTPSLGSLTGTVRLLADDSPAGGVTVTVSVGDTTVTTVTQSTGNPGAWAVSGLPVPGAYTLTFARDDLQSQTIAVSVDATGGVSGGSVDVSMRSATAVVQGIVTQRAGDGTVSRVGEADVVLSSGTDEYRVVSASQPAGDLGRYRITGVAPGTYTLTVSRTGTSPTTVMVTVTAGQIVDQDAVLIQPASISGTVTLRDGGSPEGLQVALFQSARYPAEYQALTTVDADGRFSFPDIDAPQSYVVEVRTTTGSSLGSASAVVSASQQLILPLTVGAPPAETTTTTPTTTPTTTTTTTTPAAVTPEECVPDDAGGGC